MGGDEHDHSDAGLPARRLVELLKLLGEKGLNQSQIAKRVGTPTQYLSDVKHERRPMSELFARRLGEEFKVNFLWLLGVEDSRRV
jgi:transcriptional regulator with XRE-family HTH domain